MTLEDYKLCAEFFAFLILLALGLTLAYEAIAEPLARIGRKLSGKSRRKASR